MNAAVAEPMGLTCRQRAMLRCFGIRNPDRDAIPPDVIRTLQANAETSTTPDEQREYITLLLRLYECGRS